MVNFIWSVFIYYAVDGLIDRMPYFGTSWVINSHSLSHTYTEVANKAT